MILTHGSNSISRVVIPPGYEDLGGEVGPQPVTQIGSMIWTTIDYNDTYYSFNQYVAISTGLKNGWRVPTSADINTLINAVGGQSKAYKLMSTDWGGTDEYGFNANPNGYYKNIDANFTDGNYFFIGTQTKTSNNTRFNSLRIRSTSDISVSEISSVFSPIYDKVRIKVRFCRNV